MSLSKEQILACTDVVTQKVEVPEWNGHVYIRMMTAKGRDEFETMAIRSQVDDPTRADVKGLRSLLVVLTLCDQAGDLLFSKKDIGIIEQKSASALDRIILEAQKLNGLNPEAVEEAKKN